jgi:hypothetical protein
MLYPIVIQQKSFHHNNLILEIHYLSDFNLYSINIFRDNTSENFDIFGIFENLELCQIKFNSIKL